MSDNVCSFLLKLHKFSRWSEPKVMRIKHVLGQTEEVQERTCERCGIVQRQRLVTDDE